MEVMTWLLREQYVCLDENLPQLWRVTKGSGMGLKHSSYIADLAFATLGDTWMTRREVLKNFQIVYLKRFRDDLLIISRDSDRMPFFFRCLRARLACAFKILVTEVSSVSVVMLAVEIFVDRGRFNCRPRTRPCNVPLSFDSAHPPTVHRWWPAAHCLSTRRLCSRAVDYERWLRCFFARLSWFHTPPSFVEWLRVRARSHLRNSMCKRVSNNVWFVLDWHSIHEQGLMNRAMRVFVNSAKAKMQLASELGKPPGIGLAWRCAGRRLVTITRQARADGGRGGRRLEGGNL
jgi:hypothetical protein